jgi:hemoglobin-like flavoprotein
MEIEQSLRQVLGQQETVVDLFYVTFLDRYPEVRPYFAGVNLRHQAVLLTMALMVIEGYYSHGYPATEAYLRYLGSRHHGWGIAPEHYPKFRDALLATLEQFHGSDWEPELARQWREAIDRAIKAMLQGYKQHFTV